MLDGFTCVNLFTANAAALLRFYRDILEIPVLFTLNSETDGVNLGFRQGEPTLCIWDSTQWGSPVRGTVSLVFHCADLDATCEKLAEKGIQFAPPVRYDWGTYELRLADADGNEVVIVEQAARN